MSETTSSTADSEVPIWPIFVAHVLQVLSGGQTLHRRDIVSRAIDSAGLTEAARTETLNTGGLRSEQRLGWAISNLLKAGWIERPVRANYRITKTGLEWFSSNPDGISDFSTARVVFAPFWHQRFHLRRTRLREGGSVAGHSDRRRPARGADDQIPGGRAGEAELRHCRARRGLL